MPVVDVVAGARGDFFMLGAVDKSHRLLLLVPFQERCRQAIKPPGFKQMRWEVVEMRGFYRAAIILHFYWGKKNQHCNFSALLIGTVKPGIT